MTLHCLWMYINDIALSMMYINDIAFSMDVYK